MNAKSPARPRVPAHVLLSLSSLFWAGNFVVGRALRDLIDPVPLAFWRWVVALLILLPFGGRELVRLWPLVRANGRLILALGATGVVGFQVFVYLALQTTTALNALLFMATLPLAIQVCAFLVFRERLTGMQALGALLSLAGALTVIVRGDPANLLGFQFTPGDLWMLAAVVSWAIYSVLLMRRPADLPAIPFLCTIIAAGIAILAPLYLWHVAAGNMFEIRAESLAGILYVGIAASALAFLFWNRGVALIGPSRAGVFIHLMPVFGAILSVLLLGERIAAYHVAGAALVVAGIALAGRRRT